MRCRHVFRAHPAEVQSQAMTPAFSHEACSFFLITGAWVVHHCARRTTTDLPWAFREHEGPPRPPGPLTGWNIGDIRRTMNIAALPTGDEKQWYQWLWAN